MDVGPWALPGAVSNVPKMISIGLAYQYWLAIAHVIGRSSTSKVGKDFSDWMARAFARFAKKSLGDKANVTGTVTSDACYPYYYIHRNFILELFGVQRPLHNPDNAKYPSCPCLFFYGTKKPIKFHDPAWERGLNQRDDCHVR